MADPDSRGIMARAVLVPVDLDLSVSQRRFTPAERQKAQAEALERRREQVKCNIIALTVSKGPSEAAPIKPATKAETDRLIKALKEPSKPNHVKVRKPGDALPRPTSSQVSFPGARELDLAIKLTADYDRHVNQAKTAVLAGRPFTSNQGKSPMPPPPNRQPSYTGSIIGQTRPRASTDVPPTAGPSSATAPSSATSTAKPAPVRSSSTDDIAGRRQESDPAAESRRRSIGIVRSDSDSDRVEGFFPPGQHTTKRPEEPKPKTNGNVIDRSRDPRKRASTSGNT